MFPFPDFKDRLQSAEVSFNSVSEFQKFYADAHRKMVKKMNSCYKGRFPFTGDPRDLQLKSAAVNSETGEEVTIKKIDNYFDNIMDEKRTLGEIKLLPHMNHENIIAIKDILRPLQQETFNDAYIMIHL